MTPSQQKGIRHKGHQKKISASEKVAGWHAIKWRRRSSAGVALKLEACLLETRNGGEGEISKIWR